MFRRGGARKPISARRLIVLRCRMPEKFLEKAREEGVGIVQASCGAEHELRLNVREGDARKLREMAEKYSLEIVRESAFGPDAGRFLKAAWPFLAGFLLVLGVFSQLGGYIWKIEVSCPQGGDEGALYAALEEAGIREGDSFPGEERLARELESLCPGYAHISVRRDGLVLKVDAYRETQAPELYDAPAARDIVSKYDAVVEEVRALAGRAAVRPGDVVKKGQALILGEEKQTDETTRGVRALGEATGMIWVWAEREAVCEREISLRTGRERLRTSLHLAGWEFPAAVAQDFARQETERERVVIGGLFVPVHIVRERLFETEAGVRKMAPEQALAALEASAAAEAMAKLPQNAQIVDKWTDYSMIEGNRWRFRICLQARTPIAAVRGGPETK